MEKKINNQLIISKNGSKRNKSYIISGYFARCINLNVLNFKCKQDAHFIVLYFDIIIEHLPFSPANETAFFVVMVPQCYIEYEPSE